MHISGSSADVCSMSPHMIQPLTVTFSGKLLTRDSGPSASLSHRFHAILRFSSTPTCVSIRQVILAKILNSTVLPLSDFNFSIDTFLHVHGHYPLTHCF